MQPLLHLDELLLLALEQPRHGHAGPLADDLGDLLGGDFLAQQTPAALVQIGQLLLAVFELLLQLRQLAVADARGLLQVAAALGVFQIGLPGVDLLPNGLDGFDRGLLVLPLGGEDAVALLQVRQLFLVLGELPAAAFVALLLQRLALDLELHGAAAQLVELAGQRVVLDSQARCGFVDQVDCLVRQMAVADVAVRKNGGRHEGRVLDAHAVVGVVARLEATQDSDGVLDGWLADVDGLEAAFEGFVLLDVLAILVERRRADAAQLAAG